MHDKVYKVYAANCKKCEAVAATIKDWISKMEALVKMWESQAGKAQTLSQRKILSKSHILFNHLKLKGVNFNIF